MEIIMKDDTKKVPFYSLNIGNVFMYNNLLFMKTEMIFNSEREVVNAVRLDGRITNFANEDVIPIEGKFIVD